MNKPTMTTFDWIFYAIVMIAMIAAVFITGHINTEGNTYEPRTIIEIDYE